MIQIHLLFLVYIQTGATPLYIACQQGHSDTVDTLIQNGADINQPKKVLYTTIQ